MVFGGLSRYERPSLRVPRFSRRPTVMRPRRLSIPPWSERIRERRVTSNEPSSIGTWTRRPSLVTTTATRRRSSPFEIGTVRAVYERMGRSAMAAESKRPPGTRRSLRLPRSRSVLLPALSGFENKSRARDGHQRDEDPKLRSLEGCLHGYVHRIPAPIVRAIAPSSMMACVKRARFAFI